MDARKLTITALILFIIALLFVSFMVNSHLSGRDDKTPIKYTQLDYLYEWPVEPVCHEKPYVIDLGPVYGKVYTSREFPELSTAVLFFFGLTVFAWFKRSY